MSDTLNLANSIWPNGIKVDSDGYAVFYPLGTNKVNVPTSSSEWPKGNKFVSPFVYQDDKLVGFVDTKALTIYKNTTIYLPYEHIEAEFSEIDKGRLQIHAPNATTKKVSWKNTVVEDIPEVQFKYKGRTTVDDVKSVDANYQTTDIIGGIWSEPLWDLVEGGNGFDDGGLFGRCTNLETFSSDLPNLTNGDYMFYNCNNLASFSSDLSSLTDVKHMFYHCENLETFSSDLSSLTNVYWMFEGCNKLSSFHAKLPSLIDGEGMFYACNNLTSFNCDLPSLTNGQSMFSSCDNLASFSSDLSSLGNGSSMFYDCYNLETFSSDLPSLTDGSSMFHSCYNLTSFTSKLPSLTDGSNMFNRCSQLTSFSSDLSNLEDGYSMFDGCEKLTSFNSNLSSLTEGYYMFDGCKLDTASIQNIADTINTVSSGRRFHIGIGNSTPNELEEAAFKTIADKGWYVYVGVNGGDPSKWNPTSLIPIDGEETTTPIPFWAKPVPSDEQHARYVDAEGNFFNILGGNYIYGDDMSTYGMFISEEDAAANMRLTPYVKPQTKIENQ